MGKKEDGKDTAIAPTSTFASGLLAAPGEDLGVDINQLVDPSVKPTENEKTIVDIRISQKMSKIADVISPGKLYASTGQELGTQLDVIFLWSGRSAGLLDKNTLRQVCGSRDGIMGSLTRTDVEVNGVEYRIGGECKSCQVYYDGWDNLPKGAKSPLCSKNLYYPAIIVGGDALTPEQYMELGPVLFRFKRTSAPAGKLINTYCQNRPKYMFAFRLTAVENPKDTNKSFMWTATPLGRVTTDWVERCAELVKNLQDMEIPDEAGSDPTPGNADVTGEEFDLS